MTTQEKLERIHNRSTKYELAAIKGEEKILIAYSAKGRPSLSKAVFVRIDAVIRRLGIGESDIITWGKKADEGAFVNGWNIRFTGRTQREAILSHELPYVGEEN